MKTLLKIKKNGSVLALAICILAILLVLGIGFLSLGLNSRITAIRDASVIVARSAADAGLTQVMHEMTTKLGPAGPATPTIPGVSLPDPPETLPGFTTNAATYAAKADDASPTGTRWYCRAESTGYYNQAARKVVARLAVTSRFNALLYTKECINLYNSSIVGCPSEEAIVGTNSDAPGAVDIKMNAAISGDVWTGGDPSQVIDDDPGGNTGKQLQATEPYPFDPAEDFMPDALKTATNLGDAAVNSPADPNTPFIIDSSVVGRFVKYNKIDLPQNGVIQIYPPATGDAVTSQMYIYLTESSSNKYAIDIKQSARLEIWTTNPDAKVNLFVAGNILLRQSGPINYINADMGTPVVPPVQYTSMDARKLKIWGLSTCTSISCNEGGTAYVDIYAPSAEVNLNNGFPIVGSVIAKCFTASQGSSLTCYEQDQTPFEPGAYFVIDRWWEGAVGETPPDIMP